ncbi:MAG TPA: F0F1 ATP synthase subunit epsilon [Thermoanaerobaculia bacterium]|nr:F0F1 ATP synthase subunit epsilon [Thermoanaerobaculia bacterium]
MADFRLPTKIQLTLVTTDLKLLELEADEVVLPGLDGQFGVLPGHTPMLAALGIGEMSYREGGRKTLLVVAGGFAEVLPDRVIVLAEAAYRAEDIDRGEAERMRTEAERELASLASHDEGFALAQARLEESLARTQVVSRRE